jgi:Transcription factor WhiB
MVPEMFELSVEPWMEHALCRGRPLGAHDTSNLPPSQSPRHRREARRLCQGCETEKDCAAYAIKTKASGVVMAGIPLRMAGHNDDLYAELKSIVGENND